MFHTFKQRCLKIFSASLALIFFLTNAALSYSPQTNFWTQRNAARQNLKPALSNPSIPTPKLPHHNEPFLPFLPHYSKLINSLSHLHGKARAAAIPKNWNKKIVVHIQDVHQNAEAQTNIGKSLEKIFDVPQVGLLALEGEFETINLSRFRDFSDQKTLRQVADYFLRKGEMAGSVHAALFNAKIPTIVGVDAADHYNANVEAYRSSSKLIEETKSKLSNAQKSLQNQKAKTFSKDLFAFDQRVEAYRNETISLSDHLGLLTSGQDILPLQLELFKETLKMEASIDFKKVEAERTKLIAALVEKLTPEQAEALTQASNRFRTGQTTAADFYLYLQQLCNDVQLSMTTAPAFDSFVRYTLMAENIDMDAVMSQLDTVEEARYAEFQPTAQEKALLDQSKYLHLAMKLIDYSLSSKEWNEYESSRKTINLSSFEKFYREAEARDNAMATNLLSQMDKNQTSAAILVSGGFHSDGIAKRLAQAGVATIKFVPTLTKVEHISGAATLSVFNQEKGLLDQLFEGTKLFLTARPTGVLNDLAAGTAAASPNGDSLLQRTDVRVERVESGQATLSRGAVRAQPRVTRNANGDIEDFQVIAKEQNFTLPALATLLTGLLMNQSSALNWSVAALAVTLPFFLSIHKWATTPVKRAYISLGFVWFGMVTLVSFGLVTTTISVLLGGTPAAMLLASIPAYFISRHLGIRSHLSFNQVSPVPANSKRKKVSAPQGEIRIELLGNVAKTHRDIKRIIELEQAKWKATTDLEISKKEILRQIYGNESGEGNVRNEIFVARSNGKIVGVAFGIRAVVQDDLSKFSIDFDAIPFADSAAGNSLLLYSEATDEKRQDREDISFSLVQYARKYAADRDLQRVVAFTQADFFQLLLQVNQKFFESKKYLTDGDIDSTKIFKEFKKLHKKRSPTFRDYKNFFSLSAKERRELKKDGFFKEFAENRRKELKKLGIAPTEEDAERFFDLKSFDTFEEFANFYITKIGDPVLTATHQKYGAKYAGVRWGSHPQNVTSAGSNVVMVYDLGTAAKKKTKKDKPATAPQKPSQTTTIPAPLPPQELAVRAAVENGNAISIKDLTDSRLDLDKIFEGSPNEVAEKLLESVRIYQSDKRAIALANLVGHLTRGPTTPDKLKAQLKNLQDILRGKKESSVPVRLLLSHDLMFLDGRQMLALSAPSEQFSLTVHYTTLQAGIENKSGLTALFDHADALFKGSPKDREDEALVELWMDAAREEGLAQNRVFTNVNGIAVIPVLQILQEEGILDMFLDSDVPLKLADVARKSKKGDLNAHSVKVLQELGAETNLPDQYATNLRLEDNMGNLSKALEILVTQGFFKTTGINEETTFEATQLGYKAFAIARDVKLARAVRATRLLRQLHPFVHKSDAEKRDEAIRANSELQQLLALKKQGWDIKTQSTNLLDQHVYQHMRLLCDGMLATSCIAALGMPHYKRMGDGVTIKEVGPDILRYFANEEFTLSLGENSPLASLDINHELVLTIFDVMESLGYVTINREKQEVTLTTFGQEVLRNDSSVGVPEAYRPLSEPGVLRHLMTGIPYPLHLDKDQHMGEYGRVLDIWGSTRQHDSNYAVAAREMLRRLFNLPPDKQPAGLLDVGGGDGHNSATAVEWLIMETQRGFHLASHPFVSIITDFNPAALGRQKQTLDELKIKLKAKFELAQKLLEFANGRNGDTKADVEAIIRDALASLDRQQLFQWLTSIKVKAMVSYDQNSFAALGNDQVVKIVASVFSGDRKKTWFLNAYRGRDASQIETGIIAHVIENDVTDVADLDNKIRALNISHATNGGEVIGRANFPSMLGFLVEERGLNILDAELKKSNPQQAINDARVKAKAIFVERVKKADRRKLWEKIEPMIRAMEYQDAPRDEAEFLDTALWTNERVAELVMNQYSTSFTYKGRFLPGFVEAADAIQFLNQLVRGAKFPTIILDQHTPRLTPGYQKKTQEIPSHLQSPLFAQQSSAASYRWTQGMSHQWIPSREEDELTMFLAGITTDFKAGEEKVPAKLYPTPGKSGKPVVISVTPMMPVEGSGISTDTNAPAAIVLSASVFLLWKLAFSNDVRPEAIARYKKQARVWILVEVLAITLSTFYGNSFVVLSISAVMFLYHVAMLIVMSINADMEEAPNAKRQYVPSLVAYTLLFGLYAAVPLVDFPWAALGVGASHLVYDMWSLGKLPVPMVSPESTEKVELKPSTWGTSGKNIFNLAITMGVILLVFYIATPVLILLEIYGLMFYMLVFYFGYGLVFQFFLVRRAFDRANGSPKNFIDHAIFALFNPSYFILPLLMKLLPENHQEYLKKKVKFDWKQKIEDWREREGLITGFTNALELNKVAPPNASRWVRLKYYFRKYQIVGIQYGDIAIDRKAMAFLPPKVQRWFLRHARNLLWYKLKVRKQGRAPENPTSFDYFRETFGNLIEGVLVNLADLVPFARASNVPFVATEHMRKLIDELEVRHKVKETSLLETPEIEDVFDMKVWGKMESEHQSTAFKYRIVGQILNWFGQMTSYERAKFNKILVASTGNQALAVAMAVKILREMYPNELGNLKAVAFVAGTINPEKLRKLTDLDVDLVHEGRYVNQDSGEYFDTNKKLEDYGHANEAAEWAYHNDPKSLFIRHGSVNVMQAYSTIGPEIDSQLEKQESAELPTAVLVPLGAGGLYGAIKYVLINIQARLSNVWAWLTGTLQYRRYKTIPVITTDIITGLLSKGLVRTVRDFYLAVKAKADGIAVPTLDHTALEALTTKDEIYAINPDRLHFARMLLINLWGRFDIEHTSSLPLAILMQYGGRLKELGFKQVVMIISGGNAAEPDPKDPNKIMRDPEVLRQFWLEALIDYAQSDKMPNREGHPDRKMALAALKKHLPRNDLDDNTRARLEAVIQKLDPAPPASIAIAPSNAKFLLDLARGKNPTQADAASYKKWAVAEALSMIALVFAGKFVGTDIPLLASALMFAFHLAMLALIGKSPYLNNSLFLNSLVHFITFGAYALLGYFAPVAPTEVMAIAAALAGALHLQWDTRFLATLPKAQSLGVNDAGSIVRTVQLSQSASIDRMLLPVLANLARDPKLKVIFKVTPRGDDTVDTIAAAVLKTFASQKVPRNRVTFNLSDDLSLEKVLAEAYSGSRKQFRNGLWKSTFNPESARYELIKTTDGWDTLTETFTIGGWLTVNANQVLQVMFNMTDPNARLEDVIQKAMAAMVAA